MSKYVWEEARLRGFFKCPAFHAYGGTIEPAAHQVVLKNVFERCTYEALQGNVLYKKDFPTIIGRELTASGLTKRLSEGALLKTTNETIRRLDALWKPLTHRGAVPALPPRVLRTRVSKTALDVTTSGVYREPWQGSARRYIGYLFSPYTSRLDMLNDPVVWFQIEVLAGFIRSVLGTEATLIRVIASHPTDLIMEEVRTKFFSQHHKDRLRAGIRTMESGDGVFPIVPCPDRSCSKQQQCLPVINR